MTEAVTTERRSNRRELIQQLDVALRALTIVEDVLASRDFRPDSSARHNLSIAQSIIRQVQGISYE